MSMVEKSMVGTSIVVRDLEELANFLAKICVYDTFGEFKKVVVMRGGEDFPEIKVFNDVDTVYITAYKKGEKGE